jgi:GNAT superfamily N-acetyltransferase
VRGDELAFRPATPADEGQILELMKTSLGDASHRRLDYWRWKHVHNPFGPSASLLAFAGEQLVGLRLFMRWMWHARGRDVPSARAVDTATHPDWQGRGIFKRLTLSLLDVVAGDGTRFIFNTPNDKSRPGYLKMGWKSVGRVSMWVRPVASTAWLGALVRPNRPSGAGSMPRPEEGSTPRDLLHDPNIARLCAALPDDAEGLSTRPTAEYLQWRYADVPGIEYEAAWSSSGDEGCALIFRRRDSGRLRELRLCQILVGDGARSRKLGREVLASAIRRASPHYVTAVAAPGTATQRFLLRAGFLPAPRSGPILTVRPVTESIEPPDPLRRASWQLSIGDVELF